jgi:hypothetical protein
MVARNRVSDSGLPRVVVATVERARADSHWESRTMSVIRMGSTNSYANGWDHVFGGGKKAARQAGGSKAASPAKKSAKKSAAAKKKAPAKKKAGRR